jgi:hypothetical protein
MLNAVERSAYILVQIGLMGSINELIKLSLHVLEYIHNTCTKSSPTRIGTPWVPSSECISQDCTHGVPKHLGGDVVHVFCIYSSACTLGFINWGYIKHRYVTGTTCRASFNWALRGCGRKHCATCQRNKTRATSWAQSDCICQFES